MKVSTIKEERAKSVYKEKRQKEQSHSRSVSCSLYQQPPPSGYGEGQAAATVSALSFDHGVREGREGEIDETFKKKKKEETKKQRERWDIRRENEFALPANPAAASPSSKTFTLIPLCVNPWQVKIEFDKTEIDSQAPDTGVVSLVQWG